MSALSSFISTYKPGRKTNLKAALRSPFGKRRYDPTSSAPHPFAAPDVIDINHNAPSERRTSSLDFFDPNIPSPDAEGRVVYGRNDSFPPVKLELDLSPEPLGDWFSGFPQTPEASAGGLQDNGESSSTGRTQTTGNGTLKDGIKEEDEDEELASSSEDVIANLEAMDASSFGKLSRWEETQTISPSKRSPPTPIKIPNPAASQVANIHVLRSNDSYLQGHSRPLSEMSSPTSSAVSGTTLARQLMGNGFVLSNDNRSSRYRSGATGLTRSDSATLPKGEHAFLKDGSFSLGPDAPPIPENAESSYVPPKTPRNSESRSQRRKFYLKRRSSTGSLYSKASQPDYDALPASPPLPRSNSVVLSPGLEMELGLIYDRSPIPESPLLPADGGEPQDDQIKSNCHSVKVEEPQVIRPDSTIMSPGNHQLSPPLSPEGGPPSSKHLDDVLDYYSLPESNEEARGFKPVFTPITEESLSQLSPPLPYRNDRRDSQRGPPPVGARSPMNFRPRGLPRRPSDPWPTFRSSSLGTVGERPHSIQMPSSGPSVSDSRVTHNSQNNASSSSSIISDFRTPLAPLAHLSPLSPLAPPPLGKVFNRQRSGSAPGPISVARDLNPYKIAVSLRPDIPDASLSAEEYVPVPQTFPRTPDGFNPIWSPLPWGASHAPSNTKELEYTPALIGNTPQSAVIPGLTNAVPNLAQQIILTRAGSNARHSRQASLSRSGSELHARSSSPQSLVDETHPKNEPASRKGSVDRLGAPKRSLPPSPNPPILPTLTPGTGSSVSLTPSASENHVSRSPSYTSAASHSRSQINHSHSASSLQDDASSKSQKKSLPLIPSPGHAPPVPEENTLEENVASTSRARVPPALRLHTQHTPSKSELAEVLSDLEDGSPEPLVTKFPLVAPPTPLQYPARNPAGRGEVPSLGAPPPYYSVYDHRSQDPAPSTGSSGGGRKELSFGGRPPSLGASHNSWASSNSGDALHLARESSTGSRRTRTRPPLPAGPRRPSQTSGFSPFAMTFAGNRTRSGSVTSIGSNSVFSGGGRRPQLTQRPAAPVFSPKFQTPPPKYRGLTMEHAKWTFTSAELQAIVSKAIKQSAEASSIRLLREEILDNEIPKEMRRLEIHKTEVKNQYKILTRRRASLLETLTAYLGGRDQDDANFALSVVEEVKDLDATLDKLAEELHATDQQMAQLDSLCQVHSSSALSMALRKLNSSFLKQVAENQVLKSKIETLTAERDEAWKQAEAVANDFDHLNDQPTSPSSKRSSRVSAVRKSSIRVSKAGLRSSNQRLSQRSSISSVGWLSSAPSTSRSPMYRQSIPPVPPIPHRRPAGILTDIPLMSPMSTSTEGITPNTGTRALVQAQDDLYHMLGITFTERGFRRSRSATDLLGDYEFAASARPRSPRSRPPGSAGRRSSFPGESALAEAHNTLNVDRNAMLATLELLSGPSS